MNSSFESAARQPGMHSSLSSVPPVCPSPRPESCGTATPNDATSGASGRVILSPTPPVECLSVVGFARPEKSSRSPLRDHRQRQVADLVAPHPVEEDRHRHGRHLLVGDVAAGVRVDQPVDLRRSRAPAVALGADQVDDVEGFDHQVGSSARVLLERARAERVGDHLVDRLMPETVSSSIPSAECSKSS